MLSKSFVPPTRWTCSSIVLHACFISRFVWIWCQFCLVLYFKTLRSTHNGSCWSTSSCWYRLVCGIWWWNRIKRAVPQILTLKYSVIFLYKPRLHIGLHAPQYFLSTNYILSITVLKTKFKKSWYRMFGQILHPVPLFFGLRFSDQKTIGTLTKTYRSCTLPVCLKITLAIVTHLMYSSKFKFTIKWLK